MLDCLVVQSYHLRLFLCETILFYCLSFDLMFRNIFQNEVEGSEPGHGMSIVTASDFLQRVVAMIDILIFASNLNLSNLEQEKMMNSGGILRQSLRLGV